MNKREAKRLVLGNLEVLLMGTLQVDTKGLSDQEIEAIMAAQRELATEFRHRIAPRAVLVAHQAKGDAS